MSHMAAISSSLKIMLMYSRLSMPTPCSPVMVPPAATQARIISRDAASTRHDELGVAAVEDDGRVQVAVAGVEHVAHAQP
jgi:hypothetical protein